MEKGKTILKLLILEIILQSIFIIIEQTIFNFKEKTMFSRSMIVMTIMILMTIILFLWTSHKSISLELFPKQFNKKYIAATIITVLLLILTPSNYSGGIRPIIILFYGSIVTPIFEETLFRGYMWKQVADAFKNEKVTYLIITILFAVWHIGYAISLTMPSFNGVVNAMVMKVLLGFVYGLIIGAVRYKCRNCYGGILVHAIINALAR